MRLTGLAPSAFRFGLEDLQPFEETIEQRVGNIKFIVKNLRLEPSTSFRDHSTLSTIAAIENIHDIPSRFSKESICKSVSESFEKSIQQNPDLKKLVHAVEKGDSSQEGAFALTSLFADFATKYAKSIDDQIRMEMSSFLESDLPFKVFDQFSLYDRTFAVFLSTLAEASASMQRLVSMSYRNRGFAASRLRLEEYKKKIRNVLTASDFTWISSFSLKLYIDLVHSEKPDELFKQKQYKLGNLNRAELDRLLRELTTNNFEFREQLIRYGPRGWKPEFNLKDPVYSTWRELNEQLAQV